jgi:predicted TIM-barrel fold metal-dependent hydrolase
MFIDIHAHHYPDAYLAACRQADSGFDSYVRDDGRLVVLQDGAVALAVPQPLPTVAQRLAAMDAVGITAQVVSVSAPSVFRLPTQVRVPLTRDLNDEMADWAAGTGGRLAVFASVPLPDVEAARAEALRALDLDGVAGIMLCTTVDRRTLDDPVFAPFLQEMSDREAVIFVHPTTGCCTDGVREYALALGLDFLAETTNAIGRMVYSGLFGRYPGIKWIFSHLGGTTPFLIHRFDNYYRQFPECREHISQLPSEILRAGSVFFDTVSTHAPAMQCAFETFPAGQFLFGTDYPHVPGGLEVFVKTFTAAANAVQMAGPDRSGIQGGNAASLLGLPLSAVTVTSRD